MAASAASEEPHVDRPSVAALPNLWLRHPAQAVHPEEVEILREEYESELDHVYADQPFTGETRYWTMMLHPRTPPVTPACSKTNASAVSPNSSTATTSSALALMPTAMSAIRDGIPTTGPIQPRIASASSSPSTSTRSMPRAVPCGSSLVLHRREFHDQLHDSLNSLELDVADVPRLRLPIGAGRRGGLRHALLARQ